MPKKQLLSSIFHSELGSRIITVLAVISVLVIAIMLSGPKPTEYVEETASPTPIVGQAGGNLATNNLNMLINEPPITSGVIVGTTAVLMIIFVGTMLEMRRNS
jgi:hypothetical protein